MKIKRFNESIEKEQIFYAAIVTDYGSVPVKDECKLFSNNFDASDYLIKWINKEYKKDFEPMKDDNNRSFINVEDNPDFKKALYFLSNKDGRFIDIIELKLSE